MAALTLLIWIPLWTVVHFFIMMLISQAYFAGSPTDRHTLSPTGDLPQQHAETKADEDTKSKVASLEKRAGLAQYAEHDRDED